MSDSAATTETPDGDPWAIPARRRSSNGTHLVDGIRAAVDAWRANSYPGASQTTRRLFNYWFEEDHQTPDGMPFSFYFCQREAVETFAYLTEIRQVRSVRDLLDFASHGMLIQPGETLRQRLAFKMATGSGKTMAMSLCIVWSYFHLLYESGSPMAATFLIVAPNVIVYERLRIDFGDGATFRHDPLIPPDWVSDFEMTVILQEEVTPITTRGVIYLTSGRRYGWRPCKPERRRCVGSPTL
jgi:type III restriction enzyme